MSLSLRSRGPERAPLWSALAGMGVGLSGYADKATARRSFLRSLKLRHGGWLIGTGKIAHGPAKRRQESGAANKTATQRERESVKRKQESRATG